MSFHSDCPACLSGKHEDHDQDWGVQPGLIGGSVCVCTGDCEQRLVERQLVFDMLFSDEIERLRQAKGDAEAGKATPHKITFHWRDMPDEALLAWNTWYYSKEREQNLTDSSIRPDHAAFNAGWSLAREVQRRSSPEKIETALCLRGSCTENHEATADCNRDKLVTSSRSDSKPSTPLSALGDQDSPKVAEDGEERPSRGIQRMRWCEQGCEEPEVHSRCHDYDAYSIITWVKNNGGEAYYDKGIGEPPSIGVRSKDGWVYIAPGHYVVMGSARFDPPASSSEGGRGYIRQLRDFHPEKKREPPKPDCRAVLRPEGIACTLKAGHERWKDKWDHVNLIRQWTDGSSTREGIVEWGFNDPLDRKLEDD